jgi:hypothetical protein
VDPRAGLDIMKKYKFLTLPRLKLRPLGRPARSQSLYGLRYRGSENQTLRGEVTERLNDKSRWHKYTALFQTVTQSPGPYTGPLPLPGVTSVAASQTVREL